METEEALHGQGTGKGRRDSLAASLASSRSQQMKTSSEFLLDHSVKRKKLLKNEPRGVVQGPPFSATPILQE